MKIIPIKIHAVLDYLTAALFLTLPFLAAWNTDAISSGVFFILGAFTFFYSIFTSYELGIVKLIPFRVHLGIDFLSGVFLAASPWIFSFADEIFLPHLAFGLFEIFVSSLSQSKNIDYHRSDSADLM